MCPVGVASSTCIPGPGVFPHPDFSRPGLWFSLFGALRVWDPLCILQMGRGKPKGRPPPQPGANNTICRTGGQAGPELGREQG